MYALICSVKSEKYKFCNLGPAALMQLFYQILIYLAIVLMGTTVLEVFEVFEMNENLCAS